MASAKNSSSGASDGAKLCKWCQSLFCADGEHCGRCKEDRDLNRARRSNHHYVFGSGMVGCLYDYGPEFCESIEDAIASLDNVFGDSISEEESESMARNLREQGIHYFTDKCEAGADYCEVSKQSGACPVWDDRTGTYIDPETSIASVIAGSANNRASITSHSIARASDGRTKREKAMQTYKTFRPTGFDAAGLGCEDRQEWLVAPCGTNRDASTLQESNWSVQNGELDKIDPDGTDHEVHRFGHWACGWLEIVLVRPDSACAKACEENEAALSDYPVLSDNDYSEREDNAVHKWWASMRLKERVNLCIDHDACIMAARHDDRIPEEVYGWMRDHLE